MKKAQLCLVVFLFGTMSLSAQSAIKIGDSIPGSDIEIEDTSGRNWTLSQVSDANGLLVIFSSNTCPWVAKWEGRYSFISTLTEVNDIGMIVINSNERIRSRGEAMGDMRRRAQKKNYSFTYALDEDHAIADAFGATKTPEVFLFDSGQKLVYHGAIDDNANNANATEQNYVEDALNALANGEALSVQESEVVGCTIKRSK